MKLRKHLWLSLTLLMSISSAQADIIHTVYFRTRSMTPITLKTVFHAGYWQNGACNIYRSLDGPFQTVSNENADLPLEGGLLLFMIGPAFSCMELEFISEHTRDKGSFQLVWDEELFTYVASIPNGSNLSINS